MKKLLLALTAVTMMASPVMAADIFGSWTTPDKKSIIEISKCGGEVCGVVTKTAEPDQKDVENPDEALRGRAIKGLQIFKFKDNGSGRKWEGDLYNTRDGKTYSGHIEMQSGDNQIKLEGCVFIFCKGETWSRI